MTSVPHSSAKIDRLSSLPPELLLTIFDLAYDPGNLLLEPLSKQFLPYFRRNLYRQIRLSSISSFERLLETLRTYESLILEVKEVDISAIRGVTDPRSFNKLLNLFPRLDSLKLGYVDSLWQRSRLTGSLASLNHLSYRCLYPETTQFRLLSKLPLRTLQIDLLQSDIYLSSMPNYRLTSLDKLSLSSTAPPLFNEGRMGPALATIIDSCPNITALALFDSHLPTYAPLLLSIKHKGSHLNSLELDSPSLLGISIPPCDYLLPHFPNLTHLSLCRCSISNSLPMYLRHLLSLTSLRLGPDAHLSLDVDSLLSLFEGSSRHPCLELLILDCLEGEAGHRADEDYTSRGDVYTAMNRDGWRRPIFHQGFEKEDVTVILSVCKENGVRVEGGGADVLRLLEMYDLEEANRIVLRCFRKKRIEDPELWYDNPRLLDNQLAELDFDNLELVKIDLPEENWFALTLE